MNKVNILVILILAIGVQYSLADNIKRQEIVKSIIKNELGTNTLYRVVYTDTENLVKQ